MKIALIGASGFVGTRIIDLLKEESGKYEIKNIDLLPSIFFNDITEIGDVRNQEQMNKALQGFDLVILLAAQHTDDVYPISLYYETNVKGMENTLNAMQVNGIKRLIFFSSVAVYGLDKLDPAEDFEPKDPFNHYGKSKWQAEQLTKKWYEEHQDWNIDIIRPAVMFGERRKGNMYYMLKQIASGKYMMVGDGNNYKSMSYVGNIVAFVKYMIENVTEGYNVFNWAEKPDLTMNGLVPIVSKVLNKKITTIHVPYFLGILGGFGFDLLSKISGKKLAISSVRVKKFCATTSFNADKAHSVFNPPFTMEEGLERTLKFEFMKPKSEEKEETRLKF